MQNLIKSNNLVLKSNILNETLINNIRKNNNIQEENKINYDIEKNLIKENVEENSDSSINVNEENKLEKKNNIYLNGKKQKKIGKVFSIFIICVLSVCYMSSNEFGSAEKIVFNNNSIMNLNEYADNSNIFSNITNYLYHTFILMLIIMLYFPIHIIIRWKIKFILSFLKKEKIKFVKNL